MMKKIIEFNLVFFLTVFALMFFACDNGVTPGGDGTITVTGGKPAGAAVDAPTLSSNTHNSITINAVVAPANGQTVEYAKNTTGSAPAEGWQDGLVFGSLTPSTGYYIFARSKENASFYAGPASAALTVTTDAAPGVGKSAGAAVAAPTLASKTHNSITIKAVPLPGNGQTVEYAKNTTGSAPAEGWQDGLVFGSLTPLTGYYIFARSKENASFYAGPASAALTVSTNAVPYYTVTFNSNGGSAVSSKTGIPSDTTISAPAVPAKAGYACVFAGWYDAGLVNKFNFTTPITGNLTLYAKWEPYAIGATGPGGGKIFYRNEAGFTVEGLGTCRYLEAAPANITVTLVWAPVGSPVYSNITGAAGTAIGTGRKNAAAILAAATPGEAATQAPAAYACSIYGTGTPTEGKWFLPSKDELNELYKNKRDLGIPDSGFYWSSSQGYSGTAWLQNFVDGVQNYGGKVGAGNVRAIRAF